MGLIAEIVNTEMLSRKFQKKASAWYKTVNDVVQIVGLQKSSWGPQYYINLGVWLNEIDRKQFPKVAESHIQHRLDSLDDMPGDVASALDAEDPWRMDPDTRKEILKVAIGFAVFTFFNKVDCLQTAKKFVVEQQGSHYAVKKSLNNLI